MEIIQNLDYWLPSTKNPTEEVLVEFTDQPGNPADS